MTHALDIFGVDTIDRDARYIPSVCAMIVGPPYPARGVAAGVLEIIAALFLPTALRIVVGGIGVLRVIFGGYHYFFPVRV